MPVGGGTVSLAAAAAPIFGGRDGPAPPIPSVAVLLRGGGRRPAARPPVSPLPDEEYGERAAWEPGAPAPPPPSPASPRRGGGVGPPLATFGTSRATRGAGDPPRGAFQTSRRGAAWAGAASIGTTAAASLVTWSWPTTESPSPTPDGARWTGVGPGTAGTRASASPETAGGGATRQRAGPADRWGGQPTRTAAVGGTTVGASTSGNFGQAAAAIATPVLASEGGGLHAEPQLYPTREGGWVPDW